MAVHIGGQNWEDLEITREDVNRIGEALKKDEFRNLLKEYVEDVTNPENIKQYQEEFTQFEKERGYDVTFLNPEGGYVIKTSVDGKRKAFINVCQNDNVNKPEGNVSTKDGSNGMNWSLPHSVVPPREDLDKSGGRCAVYDVIFHPETIKLAEINPQFKNMVNQTVLDAVEKSFQVKLDRKNLKFPKLKYKGMKMASVLRKQSTKPEINEEDEKFLSSINCPYLKDLPSNKLENNKSQARKKGKSKQTLNTSNKSTYTIPNYEIIQRSGIDFQDFVLDKSAKIKAAIPKELVVIVDLPLLHSSDRLLLDVLDKSILLKCEKPKYKLELPLPYSVDESSGNAKFDKATKKLTVVLPVKEKHENIAISSSDFGREDSGIESDAGRRTPDSSSSIEEAINEGDVVSLDEKHLDLATDDLHTIKKDSFRTNSGSNTFLSSDIHYLLPAFTCNVVDNLVAFTLHVKNVDPDSVEYVVIDESKGLHTKFVSIGAGFFPSHYAFYLHFPSGMSFIKENVSIEAWDNNVILQIEFTSCDILTTEFFVGTDQESLQAHDFPDSTSLMKKLPDLQQVSKDVVPSPTMTVEVTAATESEFEIKLTIENENFDGAEKDSSLSPDECTDVNKIPTITKKAPLEKSRTFSESSSDELSLSPTKKGILKYKGRVCRSLSESSVDDYVWSSSLDVGLPSGSDSFIPEEDEEEKGSKKTVRFNDVISEKIYRTNSSILGQRKKNQRKVRNKKRAQERRASESEASECEAEKNAVEKTDDGNFGNNIGENPGSGEFPPYSENVTILSKKSQVTDASTEDENAEDFKCDMIFHLDI